MNIEPIPEDSRQIVDTMRDYITRGLTKQSNKTKSGWRYEGDAFDRVVESLKESMQKTLKAKRFNVVGCTVRHFYQGANIQNPNYPMQRLLIIPINGTSTLTPPGNQLPLGFSFYIEDTKVPPTLSGEEIDVIFVVLTAEQDTS